MRYHNPDTCPYCPKDTRTSEDVVMRSDQVIVSRETLRHLLHMATDQPLHQLKPEDWNAVNEARGILLS